MGQYGAKSYSVYCVHCVNGFGYFIMLSWCGNSVHSVHCVNGFAISKK